MLHAYNPQHLCILFKYVNIQYVQFPVHLILQFIGYFGYVTLTIYLIYLIVLEHFCVRPGT